jgi:hypothetical protein
LLNLKTIFLQYVHHFLHINAGPWFSGLPEKLVPTSQDYQFIVLHN